MSAPKGCLVKIPELTGRHFTGPLREVLRRRRSHFYVDAGVGPRESFLFLVTIRSGN